MTTKNSSGTVSFGAVAVRNSDGDVDRPATLAKLEQMFDAWDDLQTGTLDRLESAIEDVYAKAGSENAIPTPTLISIAVCSLGMPATTHKELSLRAAEVLKTNPRYQVVKGQRGGQLRLNDDQLAEFVATGSFTRPESK